MHHVEIKLVDSSSTAPVLLTAVHTGAPLPDGPMPRGTTHPASDRQKERSGREGEGNRPISGPRGEVPFGS